MKDTFVNARLVEPDLIRMVIFSGGYYEKWEASLMIDRSKVIKLNPVKNISTSNVMIQEFRLPKPLELGHSYVILIPSFPMIPLDVSEATSFKDFDAKYFYNGNDLGANYKKEGTEWVLWAPLASSVTLKVKREKKGRWHYREMVREEKGIYRLRLKGDYDGAYYTYLVTNNEVVNDSIDPYAKASGPNGEFSVVVKDEDLASYPYSEALPMYRSYADTIIYETSVRDFTIDKHTNIVHKAQYLGMIEEKRTTTHGLPAGLDYIKSLGITHLQLMPFYDFSTIDERNPFNSYNWGYDPKQYFVPEGSYCSDINDPLSRIKECQKMVQVYHQNGIKIIMDAVYNHVYDYQTSSFEKIVPNYYFRKRYNGKVASTSGCGNDVASERPMVRKLIVDSAKFWIDIYHVNGFRFDLMGILDTQTLEEIYEYGKSKDPSFMVYGEGWNMGGEVQVPLGTMDNARLLPTFGFFNDIFREAVKAFLAEDYTKYNDLKYSYLGSCLEYGNRGPKFLNALQTINYVECHDDKVLYDVLTDRRHDYSSETKCELCKLGAAFVLLSFGIPFIHMGQEIAQSKFGQHNTHNMGDLYNKFSYRLLEERREMYDYIRSLIGFRKRFKALHLYDPRAIAPLVNFEDYYGVLKVILEEDNELHPYQKVIFFFNPTGEKKNITLEKDYLLLLDVTGDVENAGVKVQNLLLPPRSCIAVALKK